MDANLFSGFITAVNDFAQAMGAGMISSLTLHDAIVALGKQHDLMFIITTDSHVKQTALKNDLRKIQNIFFIHFPPEKIDWMQVNSLERFKVLDSEFEEYFTDSFELLKKSLWN